MLLTSQYIWWAIACVPYGLLATVLYVKRAYLRIPLFFSWISQVFLGSVLLLLTSYFAPAKVYTVVFWFFAVLEISLQIAVSLEFAGKALLSGQKWVPGTKVPFTVCAAFALLLSSVLSFFAKPASDYAPDAYYARFVLLTSVLVFLLALATLAIVYQCGSLWQTHDLYRFCGFLIWSMASFITDTLHAYWRMTNYFSALETARILISESTVLYWIYTSFHPSKINPSEKGTRGLGALTALYKGVQSTGEVNAGDS